MFTFYNYMETKMEVENKKYVDRNSTRSQSQAVSSNSGMHTNKQSLH